MPTSSNGYVVLDKDTTGSLPRLRNWVVPSTSRRLLVREASCGFLLVHLAVWFDQSIEKIDVGGVDDWGWSPRKISGTDRWSNHASGTAIDLNATKHPMGSSTRKTFSSVEVNKIHQRLKFYDECIRWGGDYSTRPDAMHFELNRNLAAVVKRAQALTDSPRGRSICEKNPGVKALIHS